MRTHLLSSFALVASLALVGCSGDDGDSTTTETDTGSSTDETSTTDTGSTPTDTGSADDTSTPMTDTGTPADTGTPTDTGGGDTMTPAATFSQVWGTIIEGKCRGCHSGTTPAGMLNMGNKANAHTNLVGKPALGSGCATKGTRVVAGNAAMSILYQKVTTPTCGVRMPAGGAPALSTAETDRIKSWINAGALNN